MSVSGCRVKALESSGRQGAKESCVARMQCALALVRIKNALRWVRGNCRAWNGSETCDPTCAQQVAGMAPAAATQAVGGVTLCLTMPSTPEALPPE